MQFRAFPLAAVCLLLSALVGPAAFGQATPPYDRTILVGGSNPPLTNGNNLLTAVAIAGGLATPTDPWLVKVEPGLFDLGTQTLDLETFVDVEGSGRNATFIRSTGNSSTVIPTTVHVASGVDAEIRNLTVQAITDGDGAAILNDSTELKATLLNLEVETITAGYGFVSFSGAPRISAMFPRVTSEEGDAIGMEIRGGGPIINEMFVFINSPGGNNFGWRLWEDTTPIIEQVSAFVAGTGGSNFGIRSTGARPRITNARITVSSAGNAFGAQTQVGNPIEKPLLDIKESTFAVSGAGAVGLSLVGGDARLQNSLIEVEAESTAIGITSQQGATTTSNQSVIRGAAASINLLNPSVFRGGATQLDGPRVVAVGATAVCAASYDGAFAPVAANCL